MGILSYGYKGAVAGGKKVFQKLSGQGKTTGKEGIRSFKPEKNLTTKRNIQDKVVKAVDEGSKAAKTPSLELKQTLSKLKKDKSKELKDYSYKSEEFFKRRQKNKKETKNLLKGAMGLTATAGVLQGVNMKLKKDEKKRKAKAKKQDEARVKKMGGGMMGRRFGYKSGMSVKGDDKRDIRKVEQMIGASKSSKREKGLIGRQSVIAKQAGDPKKIESVDFKVLQAKRKNKKKVV